MYKASNKNIKVVQWVSIILLVAALLLLMQGYGSGATGYSGSDHGIERKPEYWRIQVQPSRVAVKPRAITIKREKTGISFVVDGRTTISSVENGRSQKLSVQASAKYRHPGKDRPISAALTQSLLVSADPDSGALDYTLTPGSWTALKEAAHLELRVKEIKRSQDGKALTLSVIAIARYMENEDSAEVGGNLSILLGRYVFEAIR